MTASARAGSNGFRCRNDPRLVDCLAIDEHRRGLVGEASVLVPVLLVPLLLLPSVTTQLTARLVWLPPPVGSPLKL